MVTRSQTTPEAIMATITDINGLDDLQRISRIFQEQRAALNAESDRLTERMQAWHIRRQRIDEALERVRNRLNPTS